MTIMPYYIIYAALLISSMLSILANKDGRKISFLFAALLAILASLRYGTGADFYTYRNIWLSTQALSFSFRFDNIEPGFLIINNILKAIYVGDFIFFSFYSFAIMLFLYAGFKKLNLNMLVAMFLYFCLFYFAFTLNAMRQALAMAMFVYSLSFLIEGRTRYYFLINVLAISFHMSSVVYLLFGALWFINVSKSHLVYLAIFPGIALFIYLSGLGYETFNFFTAALGKSPDYLDKWDETISPIQWGSRLLMFAVISFFALSKDEEKTIITLSVFYIIGFSLYILFADVAMLSSRLNMAFRIIEIIVAGMLINKYEKLPSKFFVFFIFMIPYSVQFIMNISSPDNQYVLRTVF